MNSSRRSFLRNAANAGIGWHLSAAHAPAQTESVACRVIDQESGRQVPARVRLVDVRGNEVVPLGHVPVLAADAQEGDVRFQVADGEFSYQSWIDALKRGCTFVSNNPLVTFTVNGREAGSTLELTSGKDRALQIYAHAESQLPYDRLEIVRNGEVIASATPSGPRHSAEIHLEHPPGGSCWIAARALEDLHRYPGVEFGKIHRAEGTLLSSLYGTRRPENVFAHTSPLYVIVDGKSIRNWDDAQYYIRYLEHATDWLKQEARFSSAEDKKSSIAAFQQGKAAFEQRAREARRG